MKTLLLAFGLFASTLAQAGTTCELKFGYYVNCSGGAALTLINGVQVGGCEWMAAAVARLKELEASGACSSVQVVNTQCEVPTLFRNAQQREQDRRECYAKSNHL